MRYDAYRKQTSAAASAMGAEVVSLAGGYVGATFPADGAHIVVCLDLDGALPYWLAWTEDRDGERCCDDNTVTLGMVRPRDHDALRTMALAGLAGHKH